MKDRSIYIKTVLRLIGILKNDYKVDLSRNEMFDYIREKIPTATSSHIKSSIRELYRQDVIAIKSINKRYKYILDKTKLNSAYGAVSQMQQLQGNYKSIKNKISKYQVIDRKNMNKIFPNYSTANIDRIIYELKKSGYLRKLYGEKSRSRYVVLGENKSSNFIPDPIEAIVTLLEENYILCYHTALEFYGLSRYAMSFVIYIDAKTPRKINHIGDVVIKTVTRKVPEIGLTSVQRKSKSIQITDLERTLIDCIHRPKYSIGWENVLYAIEKVKNVNDEKIFNHLKHIRMPSLFAKMGVIMDHYKNEWDINQLTLQKMNLYCQKTPTRFFPSIPGTLNKKWNIYIPGDLFIA